MLLEPARDDEVAKKDIEAALAVGGDEEEAADAVTPEIGGACVGLGRHRCGSAWCPPAGCAPIWPGS